MTTAPRALPLHVRLGLAQLVPLGVLALAFLGLFVSRFQATAQAGLEAKLRSVGGLLAETVAVDLQLLAAARAHQLEANPEDVAQLLLGLRTDPEFTGAVVYEASGAPVAAVARSASGWSADLEPPSLAPLPSPGSPITVFPEADLVRYLAPVAVDGRAVGWLELDASLQRVQGSVGLVQRVGALVALGVVLVSGVLAFAISRAITRPVVALRDAAHELGEGNLDRRVEAAGGGEIGELGWAFNEMADRLQAARRTTQEAAEVARERAADLEAALARLREAQAQIVQSGKLVAIGQLAGGLAHELNNPLSAVLTYASLARERSDALAPEQREALGKLPRYLARVEDAAGRCRAIADNLLSFSRQSGAEPDRVRLAPVVERTLALVRTQARRQRVALEVEVPADLAVWGNETGLQQILTNLVLNALQAQPDGGEIRIRAAAEGDRVALTVSDAGPGIPPEHLGRVLDPFFTTKPIGEGTGLGLSIVHGIVEQFGGETVVESPAGSGATVTLRLPGRT